MNNHSKRSSRAAVRYCFVTNIHAKWVIVPRIPQFLRCVLSTRTGQITSMAAPATCATMLIIALPHNQPAAITTPEWPTPERVDICAHVQQYSFSQQTTALQFCVRVVFGNTAEWYSRLRRCDNYSGCSRTVCSWKRASAASNLEELVRLFYAGFFVRHLQQACTHVRNNSINN